MAEGTHHPDRGNMLLDALMREVTTEDYDTVRSTFGTALWLSANPDRAYAWGQVLTEHTSPADAEVAR